MAFYKCRDGIIFNTGSDHKRPNIIRGGSAKSTKPKSTRPIKGGVTKNAPMGLGIVDSGKVRGHSKGSWRPVISNEKDFDTDLAILGTVGDGEQVISVSLDGLNENILAIWKDGQLIPIVPEDSVGAISSENSEEAQIITQPSFAGTIESESKCQPTSDNEPEVLEVQIRDSSLTESEIPETFEIQAIDTPTATTQVDSANGMNLEEYYVVDLGDGSNVLLPTSSIQHSEGGLQPKGSMESNSPQIDTSEGQHKPEELIYVSDSTSSGVFSIYNNSMANERKPVKRKFSEISTPTSKIFRNVSAAGLSSPALFDGVEVFESTSISSSICNSQSVSLSTPRLSTSSDGIKKASSTAESKPRPFRFDLPECEDLESDHSSDYLSLVIKQFQKENKK